MDHRLSQVYRVGAGLMGLVLVAFGILGLLDRRRRSSTRRATASRG